MKFPFAEGLASVVLQHARLVRGQSRRTGRDLVRESIEKVEGDIFAQGRGKRRRVTETLSTWPKRGGQLLQWEVTLHLARL